MKHFFLLLIRGYRYFISPFLGIGAQCRFSPTCSAYAMEAFEKLPWFKAIPLVCWRLLRCQPFSKGGFDPVFPKKE